MIFACSVPRYVNWSWIIVNFTLNNNIEWNLNENKKKSFKQISDEKCLLRMGLLDKASIS